MGVRLRDRKAGRAGIPRVLRQRPAGGAIRPAVLAAVALFLLACSGGDDEPRRPESASIDVAPAGAAGITGSGSSDYGEWAREVCDILERSLVQFETISVSGDDLAGFFRSASANAGSVAKELAGVKAASGTGVFMTEAAATFEALVPLLSRAGNELEAAATGPEALQAMGAVLAAREPEINAVLERVRVSAKADLPPEAVRALSQTQPCGSVYRP